MKTLIITLGILLPSIMFSQMGQIWPCDTRQEFDVDADFNITQYYEEQVVCQFFMFIGNNEFIHVTDDITSLYKITARDETIAHQPIYTVTSEAGNDYIYMFDTEASEVYIYSTKGYGISFQCLDPYSTYVFPDIEK